MKSYICWVVQEPEQLSVKMQIKTILRGGLKAKTWQAARLYEAYKSNPEISYYTQTLIRTTKTIRNSNYKDEFVWFQRNGPTSTTSSECLFSYHIQYCAVKNKFWRYLT